MKIPHYLHLARSGRWHFRRRVPADLVKLTRRVAIKKSLGTSQLAVAQVRAIAVNAQCLSIFAALRSRLNMTKPSTPQLAAEDLARFDYTVRIDLTDGTLINTDGSPEEHERVIETLKALGPHIAALQRTPSPPASLPLKPSRLSLAEAARLWSLSLGDTIIAKTAGQMRKAVGDFISGRTDRGVADVGRTDVSEWIQKLRNSNIATPTICNKLSYVSRFFDWTVSSGHRDEGPNPARGQIAYSRREKLKRKKKGWRPFSVAEIQTIYSPEAFERLASDKRWASLLVLYTGARISEIAQLAVADIKREGDVDFIDITDEGPGQSLKTASSRRRVPIHPDLVRVGFLTHVGHLRQSGERWLFRAPSATSKNGAGSRFSQAFGRYINDCLSPQNDDADHKEGYHSLRKSVIQRMQDGDVRKEHRVQYSGHEATDVHQTVYSRLYSPAELALAVHPALDFGLELDRLWDLMQVEHKRSRRKVK